MNSEYGQCRADPCSESYLLTGKHKNVLQNNKRDEYTPEIRMSLLARILYGGVQTPCY